MEKDVLLEKWLNDSLTEAEMQKFRQRADYTLNVEVLEMAKSFKASEFSLVDDFETFKRHYDSKNKSSKMKAWRRYVWPVAALLVVGFGLYFSFFNTTLVQVETLASEKIQIELPDASVVHLNALSSIEYNKKEWAEKRNLKLDGEAYFKVAKGATFEVLTSDGTVSVVGTQFNIKQRHNYFEVKCFEGIVRVKTMNIVQELKAGDMICLFEGDIKYSKIKAIEPAWTSNRSLFEAATLNIVFEELERQFDVELETNDVDLSREFSGGFTHDDLEQALISIAQPMNLSYELKQESKRVSIYEAKD